MNMLSSSALRKALLALCLIVLPLMASAQMRFGYFSYDAALKAMPDYAVAQRSINDLRQKYDAEMKRAEEDFNAKYEEFLDVQHDLVPAILRKRQMELQEMMQKNATFKGEAQRLLEQATTDAFAPVKRKLENAVKRVGQKQGYAFVLNTDGDACPYVNPEMGEDATQFIKDELGR